MKIAQQKVAKLHYSVMDKDQTTIDSSFDGEPLEFIIGSGFLISGLESALIGKQAGDTFTADVDAVDAYGERHDGLMQAVPRNMFEGMEIEVGMQFRATTDEGEQTVIIIDIQENDVIVDGNHPLAGIDLTFDVEVLAVRDATEEELAHGHVHGEGGCGSTHSEEKADSCCASENKTEGGSC